MAFDFSSTLCDSCPFGLCLEDRRSNPVPGRETKFRIKQTVALGCTFSDFVPGSELDPDTTRTYKEYFEQFKGNLLRAGSHLFGSDFDIKSSAIAKVSGDIFEIFEATTLWNAVATWNRYMDTGSWTSPHFQCPEGSIPTPDRKIAVIKLPRNYDATLLFNPTVRANIQAFEHALNLRNMELGLSCPDIVGVRINNSFNGDTSVFNNKVEKFTENNINFIENAYRLIEGKISGADFLFAIAIKKTVRSDRLYQPLFEANVLKYLIQEILRGASFRFHVHVNSPDGANVAGHYRAASLFSLLRGGEPQRAVDRLHISIAPRETAQFVLDDFPLFPV